MPLLEAIAYHGWGFDAACWNRWAEAFRARQIQFQAFDRGYFGAAAQPQVQPHSRPLLLVHSFGLHLCPLAQLQQATALVIFSSFATFHPAAERPRRRSQRVLQQMIQACEAAPEAVLLEFYANCGYAAEAVGRSLNAPLLTSDLQALDTVELQPETLAAICQIPHLWMFHGDRDAIVPLAQAQDLQQRLQSHRPADTTPLFRFADAKHALPFTHPAACGDRLWTLLQAAALIG